MVAEKIHIMGIVNLTADSFYPPSRMLDGDGKLACGRFLATVRRMAAEGASWLDLGACSTRPGSTPVSEQQEWARIAPALEALRSEAPELLPLVSVDTFRSGIVSRVFDAIGPFLVNDISGGAADPAMLPLVASLGLPYVAMHMRGTPETMDSLTDYPEGVVAAVHRWFEGFSEHAEALGIREWILDPGFGFAKTFAQNHELLEGLSAFRDFGRPILAGISRKRMVRESLGAAASADEILAETSRLHRIAIAGGATILRVHDVAAARREFL